MSDDARYAIKVAVGCVAALLLVVWAGIPFGAAVLITVWILMTMHREQSLTDGIFRIGGSILAGIVMFFALRMFASSMLVVLLVTASVAYFGFAHYVVGVFPYGGMLMAMIAGIAACDAGAGPAVATSFTFHWISGAIIGVLLVPLVTYSFWPELSPGFSFDKLKYRRIFPLSADQAHHARVCTAALIAVLLVVLSVDLTDAYMAVVSAVVISVAPPSAGGALTKAFHRLLGVLIGGPIGVALLILLNHLAYLSMLMTFSGVAFFALACGFLRFTKRKYAWAQAGIVLSLILLGNGNSIGTPVEAIHRLVGILWGGVIAVLVIDLFPMRAPQPEPIREAGVVSA
jgi:uncharacterized membrane protein YccC